MFEIIFIFLVQENSKSNDAIYSSWRPIDPISFASNTDSLLFLFRSVGHVPMTWQNVNCRMLHIWHQTGGKSMSGLIERIEKRRLMGFSSLLVFPRDVLLRYNDEKKYYWKTRRKDGRRGSEEKSERLREGEREKRQRKKRRDDEKMTETAVNSY